MKTLEYRSVFTNLDSLLDTRLATILVAKPELGKKIIRTSTYLTREMDTFEIDGEIISLEMFKYLYSFRGERLLTISPPTNIINIAAKVILDYNLSADMNNPNNHFKILVNTYPYKLSVVDSAILTGKFTGLINNIADVQMVNVEPNEFTIDYLKENNVAATILYDCYEIVSKMLLKSGALENGDIPNIEFITNKPRCPISKNNGVVYNNYNYPLDIEEIKNISSLVAPITYINEFMFSYIPVEK